MMDGGYLTHPLPNMFRNLTTPVFYYIEAQVVVFA